jgi:hypothetical protein
MDLMASSTALTGAEYGIVGAVAVPIVGAFIWFVRAMRADLKADRAAFREDIAQAHAASRQDISQAHAEFTGYLKDTSSKQTEVLVSVANALKANTDSMRSAETRAERRHDQVISRLDDLRREQGAGKQP